MRLRHLPVGGHTVDHAGQHLREQAAELVLADATFGEQIAQAAARAAGGCATKHATEQTAHATHATSLCLRLPTPHDTAEQTAQSAQRAAIGRLLLTATHHTTEHFHQITTINWHILPSALP